MPPLASGRKGAEQLVASPPTKRVGRRSAPAVQARAELLPECQAWHRRQWRGTRTHAGATGPPDMAALAHSACCSRCCATAPYKKDGRGDRRLCLEPWWRLALQH